MHHVPIERCLPSPTELGVVNRICFERQSVAAISLLDGVELQAARRAGLEPPFACEEAYCGCCMAMVKEGIVEMKMNDGGIDAGQIAQGWVLTCQGVPKGPVTVEYPD